MLIININDFASMRAEYQDELRLRNYDNKWIEFYLAKFDQMVINHRINDIVILMKNIGVQLV